MHAAFGRGGLAFSGGGIAGAAGPSWERERPGKAAPGGASGGSDAAQ